jgi:hypothetical protein
MDRKPKTVEQHRSWEANRFMIFGTQSLNYVGRQIDGIVPITNLSDHDSLRFTTSFLETVYIT